MYVQHKVSTYGAGFFVVGMREYTRFFVVENHVVNHFASSASQHTRMPMKKNLTARPSLLLTRAYCTLRCT